MRESVKTRMMTNAAPDSVRPGLVLLAASIAASLLFAGCGAGAAAFMSARDSEIQDATHDIATARDDAQRAKAYSSRGTAYSEKARYGRVMDNEHKMIPTQEYERLFDLAIKDHNQAVALNPASAEVYFNRAQTYYDRGSLDFVYETKAHRDQWLDAAAQDFEKAAEKDPKNDRAYDMLGMSYEESFEENKAIRAYTQEMALNPLGKRRLADAYCFFGFQHQQEKDLSAAAAAYQKSIQFGTADDKTCPYDPFANGIAIYTNDTHEYDKAWDMVHQARKAGKLLSPDLIVRLKKESGRSN